MAATLLFVCLPGADSALDRPQHRSSSTAPSRSSTGGGKALYVGTPARRRRIPAGQGDPRRALPGPRTSAPGSEGARRVDPTPLFDRVAARHPDLPRDQALGKIGKEEFSKYFGEDPVGYAAMTVRKVWRMWSGGVGEAMSSTAGRAVQVLIVAAGPWPASALLAWRRWWWELVAMATPIAIVTVCRRRLARGQPRRNEILMTLVFPLAAAALARARGRPILHGSIVLPTGRHPPRRTDRAARGRPGRERADRGFTIGAAGRCAT